MYTYYLIDHHFTFDKEKIHGNFGHLLAFNPSDQAVDTQLTLYFEDKDPITFPFHVPARTSAETNYDRWPIQPDVRFALQVQSPIPLACQSTVGWNVTGNDYSPNAVTKSPLGLRECAKSYMAIEKLTKDWYLPDGIVIDMPESIYVRESEWAVILNPGDTSATVTLNMYFESLKTHEVTVAPKRIVCIYMDDIATRNKHYGVHFSSDTPVAVQWLRSVNWYHNDEVMAYWSVPCVPGPLE